MPLRSLTVTPTRPRSPRSRRPPRRPRTGWALIPWSTLGTEGEATLAESAVTVRCLTLPDGSVPQDEDEPDVLAVVGRAY